MNGTYQMQKKIVDRTHRGENAEHPTDDGNGEIDFPLGFGSFSRRWTRRFRGHRWKKFCREQRSQDARRRQFHQSDSPFHRLPTALFDEREDERAHHVITDRKAGRDDTHDEDMQSRFIGRIIETAEQCTEQVNRRVGGTVRQRIREQEPVEIFQKGGEKERQAADGQGGDESALISETSSEEKNGWSDQSAETLTHTSDPT